jgi:hypothetical protein
MVRLDAPRGSLNQYPQGNRPSGSNAPPVATFIYPGKSRLT